MATTSRIALFYILRLLLAFCALWKVQKWPRSFGNWVECQDEAPVYCIIDLARLGRLLECDDADSGWGISSLTRPKGWKGQSGKGEIRASDGERILLAGILDCVELA